MLISDYIYFTKGCKKVGNEMGFQCTYFKTTLRFNACLQYEGNFKTIVNNRQSKDQEKLLPLVTETQNHNSITNKVVNFKELTIL